jgi:hypothetical protein
MTEITKLPFNFDFNEVVRDMLCDRAEQIGIRADTLVMNWIIEKLFSVPAKQGTDAAIELKAAGTAAEPPSTAAAQSYNRTQAAKTMPRANGKFASKSGEPKPTVTKRRRRPTSKKGKRKAPQKLTPLSEE